MAPKSEPKAKPKAKATTQSQKAPRKAKATTAAAAAATAAATATEAATAARRAAASATKAAATAVAAAAAADDAAAAATLACSAAGARQAPSDDPLVALDCPLPAFFEYIPTSGRRRSIPRLAPANARAVVPSAWAGCKCRDCFSPSCSCPCRAEVELGLSAIARGGPEAVVLLLECGDCACGGGASSSNNPAAPGQQQQLACRPTQGGCAFRVAVQMAPGSKGRGLFAREAIPAGAFVLEYAGEALTADEAAAQLAAYDEARRRWRQQQQQRAGYGDETAQDEPGGASGHALLQIRVHGRMTPHGIDATVRGNAARFVNHSCDPNLGAVLVTTRRSPDPNDAAAHAQVAFRVALFSRRAIAAGEELTMSYGAASGGPGGGGAGSARCECGAATCGGWLPSGAA